MSENPTDVLLTLDVWNLYDAEVEEVLLVVVQHRPEVLGELLQDHLHDRTVFVPAYRKQSWVKITILDLDLQDHYWLS